MYLTAAEGALPWRMWMPPWLRSSRTSGGGGEVARSGDLRSKLLEEALPPPPRPRGDLGDATATGTMGWFSGLCDLRLKGRTVRCDWTGLNHMGHLERGS